MGRQNPADWNKRFRISLVENDTHVSIGSVRFTKINGIFIGAGIIIAFILLIYCLIAFTPLRSTIPGYPDAHSKEVAVANAIRIDSLETIITKWNLYAENLSRVLSGDQTISIDSIVSTNRTKYLSVKSREELSRRDSLLRETVQQEEQFGVSGTRRDLPVEGMHFFSPIKGVVTQGFDMALHPAVDITAPSGSVVSAVFDGVVIYTGWDEGKGNVIIIQHPDNVISVYGHNQKLLKKLGESVKAGTSIALVGNTGSLTTGDHLHLELWSEGLPMDPTKLISF